MRHYDDVWATVTAAVVVCGVWAAIAEQTISTVLGTFFLSLVFGGSVLVARYDDKNPRRSMLRLLAEAVLIGAAVVGACGWLSVLGMAAWPAILAFVLSSPRALRLVVRLRRRWGGTSTRELGEPHHPDFVQAVVDEPSPVMSPTLNLPTMDLDQLCWAWRGSYVRLQRCRTVVDMAQVVGQRQQCMDELERRNPEGLSAWLSAGARAAGDPSRYVNPAGPTDCGRAGGGRVSG